jgi:hypothetical protein
MKKAARLSFLISFLTIVLMCIPTLSQALTAQEIMRATHIVNLEAQPLWFKARQPIDFIVTIKYDGGTQDGFDVGVFHEGRLVGWEMNKRFNHGMNTFKLHDSNFRGGRGDYIVKVRFKGTIFREKKFITRSNCIFTIDPKATPPR